MNEKVIKFRKEIFYYDYLLKKRLELRPLVDDNNNIRESIESVSTQPMNLNVEEDNEHTEPIIIRRPTVIATRTTITKGDLIFLLIRRI